MVILTRNNLHGLGVACGLAFGNKIRYMSLHLCSSVMPGQLFFRTFSSASVASSMPCSAGTSSIFSQSTSARRCSARSLASSKGSLHLGQECFGRRWTRYKCSLHGFLSASIVISTGLSLGSYFKRWIDVQPGPLQLRCLLCTLGSCL